MEPTIILIGAARSGTKLLRSLIAAHPAMGAVPYDINYVWRFGNESVEHDELQPGRLTPDTARRIRKHIDRYRARGGAVVEKTVSNTLRVPFVAAVFPEARFVHLVRDGRDVIASSLGEWQASPDWRYVFRKATAFPLLSAPGYALKYAARLFGRRSAEARPAVWGPRYDGIYHDLARMPLLEVCARQWVRSVERAEADLRGRDALTVRYEDLAREPRVVMRRIAAFAGLTDAPYDALDYDALVDARQVGRFSERLTPEQVSRIVRLAGPVLERVGYGGQAGVEA